MVPDLSRFADLFPPVTDPDDWNLTSRTAAALSACLVVIADQAYDDVITLCDAPADNDRGWGVFNRLPRLSWNQPASWRRQVARAADDLAADIEAGDWPEPRCTAEELVLHLALQDAPSTIELAEDAAAADGTEPWITRGLPPHPDDYDWEQCADLLFQDTDVLMLYDAALDGIENPDGDESRYLGMGDLRASNWFEWFLNVEPRDPSRPFRR